MANVENFMKTTKKNCQLVDAKRENEIGGIRNGYAKHMFSDLSKANCFLGYRPNSRINISPHINQCQTQDMNPFGAVRGLVGNG